MFDLHRSLRAWRAELMNAGFKHEAVEEFESHLFEAFDRERCNCPDEEAFRRAVESLGKPAQTPSAFRDLIELPIPLKLTAASIALIGGALILESVIGRSFNVARIAGGALLLVCAVRVWSLSRVWLRIWTAALWFSVASSSVWLSALAYVALVRMPEYWPYIAVPLGMIVASAWQLRLTSEPRVRALFGINPP